MLKRELDAGRDAKLMRKASRPPGTEMTNLVNSMDKVREGSFETPDDDPDGCLLIYKTTKDEAIATFGQEAYDRLVKNAVLHLNGKKGYTYSWSKD